MKLQHLVSLEIDVKIDLPWIKSSPPLRQLIINLPSGVYFNMDPSIATIQFEQLSQLSLSDCSCAQLQQIFRRAVRLITLKIFFRFFNPIEIYAFANVHQKQTTIPSLLPLLLFIDGADEYRNHIHSTQGPGEGFKSGGGGCKGLFRGKFHKKSVKSTENLLF